GEFAHVGSVDGWHLGLGLLHCSCGNRSLSVHEIFQIALLFIQDAAWYPLLCEVHLRKIASKRLHRGLAAESGHVGSRIAMTDVRQSRKADVRCEGHSSSVALENLVASHLVRGFHLDPPVKSARSA